jgi:glutamine kinase
MKNIHTVSGSMLEELRILSMDSFLSRYGHLRPGTYDITVPRYDENPGKYFSSAPTCVPAARSCENMPFDRTSIAAMDRVLAHHGFETRATDFLDLAERAIVGREQAKFIFSRSVSDALTLLARKGHDVGLDRDDMSYANISAVLDAHITGHDVSSALHHSVERGRDAYDQSRRLQLPPLISSPEDAFSFTTSAMRPNFVTGGVVEAPVCRPETASIGGKIVAIRQADPGYDWIFAHNICGFITAFGGANSHMAIRAGELSVPAVIGAGEALFERWANAQVLRIDCGSNRVEVIS